MVYTQVQQMSCICTTAQTGFMVDVFKGLFCILNIICYSFEATHVVKKPMELRYCMLC